MINDYPQCKCPITSSLCCSEKKKDRKYLFRIETCEVEFGSDKYVGMKTSWACSYEDGRVFHEYRWHQVRYFSGLQLCRQGTLVLSSWASPVHAFASRKSPLRMAILFPNCMSFSGPSETVHSFRSTIPRCTRNAVWINSVISAKFRWLWNGKKKKTL